MGRIPQHQLREELKQVISLSLEGDSTEDSPVPLGASFTFAMLGPELGRPPAWGTCTLGHRQDPCALVFFSHGGGRGLV